MTTLLIAQNETRESGSFLGDQLCSLKAAYLFAEHTPGVDEIIMSVSPGNEMHFLWEKFVKTHNVTLVHDAWNPGDWTARWNQWDRWRDERKITLDDGTVRPFDVYRELYLRIHGAQRQWVLCGSEQGLGRRNIYSYWWCGQEGSPDELPPEVDWFGDGLVDHPPLTKERDVYISPLAKTQGNHVFTFQWWEDVIALLCEDGVTVTVGHADPNFCRSLDGHPQFARHWGTHQEWMGQVCRHKLVACGNTGTGWLAAACGVPMITVEPHHSVMQDHRYRECGLQNIVEVVDGDRLDEFHNDMPRVASYVAGRITEYVKRRVVMTTGCYDVLHAGHVRHLTRARARGTKLIVAMNSDASVRALKGESRPVNPQADRQAVLEALRCVDEVRVFDGPDALPLIREVKPDVLCCGYGYTLDTIVGADEVRAWGGEVAVTCSYATAIDQPSTTKIVQRQKSWRAGKLLQVLLPDIAGAIRAAAPYTVNSPDKLRLIADEFLKVSHLPGYVADLGTCRGGTALLLHRLGPDKVLYCFDTWEGTPYDDPLCHHKQGEWAASLDECQRVVGSDARTHYWRGVFPGTHDLSWTPEGLGAALFCFAYCDMDTYQATKDAITFFWQRMVSGGVMVFDDYNWTPCAGVKKAVDEMFGEGQRTAVPSLFTCVVTKP